MSSCRLNSVETAVTKKDIKVEIKILRILVSVTFFVWTFFSLEKYNFGPFLARKKGVDNYLFSFHFIPFMHNLDDGLQDKDERIKSFSCDIKGNIFMGFC